MTFCMSSTLRLPRVKVPSWRRMKLVFGSREFEINHLLAGWIDGDAWDVDLVPQGGEKNQIVKSRRNMSSGAWSLCRNQSHVMIDLPGHSQRLGRSKVDSTKTGHKSNKSNIESLNRGRNNSVDIRAS